MQDALKTIHPESIVSRCVALLLEGYTIVTGTERLGHLVRDEFNLYQISQGSESWPSPQSMTWDAWLRSIWFELEQARLTGHRQLLTSNQTTLLWERLISESIREEHQDDFAYLLWHVNSTASAAKNAYRQMCSYKISTSDFGDEVSEDVSMFVQWLDKYRSFLQDSNMLDIESAPSEIIARIQQVADLINLKVAIAEIEDWTPQHQWIVDEMRNAGVDVQIIESYISKMPDDVVRVDFGTLDEEISKCASWARTVIEQNSEKCRVGIAVPNLSELQPRIERIFAATLNPNALLEKRQAHNFSFHITIGTALNQVPLVVDMFNLIELMRPKFDIECFSAVLRSDRIKGWDAESEARSKLAMNLVKMGSKSVSIANVIRFIDYSRPHRLLSSLASDLEELCGESVSADELLSFIQEERPKYKQFHDLLSKLAMNLKGGKPVSVDNVIWFIREETFEYPQLRKLLTKAGTMLSNAPKRAEYGFWSRFINDWIRHFQSPSLEGRNFGIDEFHAHQKWGELVERVAEYGFLGTEVELSEVISKLYRTASDQIITPPAIRVPIQIGGLAALSGQSFTHLWIMEMNNENIPGMPRPTPFIPVSVQKAFEIPNASSAGVEQFVDQKLSRLMSNTQQAVLSYAKFDADHEFQPSSRLTKYKATPEPTSEICSAAYEQYQERIALAFPTLEKYSNWNVDSVSDIESIRGGTGILKSQSQCPFQAFAQYRLNARQIDQLQLGISPLEHGSVTHEMFELLYEKFSSQKSLEKTGVHNFVCEAELIARQVVEKMNNRRICPLSQEILDNQVEKMKSLAKNWFEQDMDRMPFKVIKREERYETFIGNLPVNLMIDRVDSTKTGAIVIDYKTGLCSIAHLKGERPRDPQLMIYAHALKQTGEDLEGVGYAKLSIDGTRFSSFHKSDKRSEGQETWQEAQVRWERVLNRLATGFMTGDASLEPLLIACDFCHLGTLCRIDEIAEIDTNSDDENGAV